MDQVVRGAFDARSICFLGSLLLRRASDITVVNTHL